MAKIVILAALAAVGSASAVQAQSSGNGAASAVDYRSDASWLCRPGRQDACTVDQTATVVAKSGRTSTERFRPASNPKVDCFYVYPTVSTDPTPNSDMTADPAERRVVEQQFARFASQCRLFAPLYRQVTLSALRSVMMGQPVAADRELAYRDVKAAWADYLARDNGGRGVVLIGHSQGAGVLKRLVAEEIEGRPVQKQLVSALLIGTNVGVPAANASVGGELKSTPLCSSATQVGCLVTYVSFRADSPPPAESRFGKVAAPGQIAGCTNPASLGGGRASLHAYLSSRPIVTASEGAAEPTRWTTTGAPVTTPFVSTPGLLTAECVNENGFSYLSVRTEADPADPRLDRIPGDVVAGGQILKDWGLHLIDMNVAMGDLVSLVGSQSRAYHARKP